MQNQPAIFETHEIRRVYDEANETWWFSVKEGSQLVTDCHQLKMTAEASLPKAIKKAGEEE